MPVFEKKELIDNALSRAVETMTLAAQTSYRFNDRNNLTMVVLSGEDLVPIAEYCYASGDLSPLAARDGRNLMQLMKEPAFLLIIGDKRKSEFNYNCGACGYKTCAELNKAEVVESLTANGPSCQFKNINMNIAANAAAATAHRLGLFCRVFSTLAMSARALEIIPDVDMAISVAVSAGTKNPFFDRHEYWTQDNWNEIFAKEFPTYQRGFIGAVED